MTRRYSICSFLAPVASVLLINFPVQAQGSFETREYLNQTGLGMIRAAEAYGLGYTGKGIAIGILDSGISALHPEFLGKILGGYDFASNQPVTQTWGVDPGPIGHGSHVSGIMAARRDGIGMHGVAFDARLFSVRVGLGGDDDDDDDDDDGSPGTYERLAVEGYDPGFSRAWSYMAKQNLVVINNSVGVNDCSVTSTVPLPRPCNVNDFVRIGEGFNVDDLFGNTRDALYELQNAGTLMVFATGNEKQEHPDLLAGMPHHYTDLERNWLAVTAVDIDTRELASYANKCGVAARWCLAAPGSVNEDAGIASVYYEGNYIRYPGTSMAAPHVTGTVALVKEAFPFFNAYHLQQTILTTATDLTPADGVRYDSTYGWGLLNAGRAVRGPGLFVSTFDVDTMGYSATFSNDIGDLSKLPGQGPGSLIKRGNGTLTLAGMNTYTGNTTIEGGKLVVNGSVQAGTTTTVKQYGILGGSGRVGHLENFGVVAPGNSIGTLTVAGDYTALPGSVLQLEVDAQNRHDVLIVGGTANLGGTLSLSAGPYRQGQTYNFLQAATINGSFSQIDTSLLFLDPRLAMTATGLSLSVARSSTAFAAYTRTSNQHAVANVLDPQSSAPPATLSSIYDDVLNATARTMPGLMDQLSGEAHASVQSALFNQSDLWTLAVTQRLNAVMTKLGDNTALPVWISPHRQWTVLDGSTGSADTRGYTNGFYMGADAPLASGWYAGGAIGYQDGRVRTDDRDSRNDTNSYTAALYAGKQWAMHEGNRLSWRISTAYAHHGIDARRNVGVGGQQTLKTSYRAHQVAAFTELSYALAVNEQVTIEPFGRLGWTQLRTPGFSESGGNAALRASPENDRIGTLTLGWRASANLELNMATTARIAGELGWRRASGNLIPRRQMAFAQGTDAQFAVAGAPLTRNALQVALHGEINIGKNMAMGMTYAGQFGGGNASNTGSLHLNTRF
ncbi:MAG TPA: autotransporter domain-containing protein [Candidimonas sp.]|nr:autotransporter domain-containing protein [Candidimonas sp.]